MRNAGLHTSWNQDCWEKYQAYLQSSGTELFPQHPVAAKLGEKWEVTLPKRVNWKALGWFSWSLNATHQTRWLESAFLISGSFPLAQDF